MSPELIQSWLLNPFLWLAVALVVLVLELLVVSGVSLVIGLAGLLVGLMILLIGPDGVGQSVAEVGRTVLIVGAVWSLLSVLMAVIVKVWLGRLSRADDPNEVERGIGVETGQTATAEVEAPAYDDVLKGYRSRLE